MTIRRQSERAGSAAARDLGPEDGEALRRVAVLDRVTPS
jgi:hypothetical protein